MNIWTIVTKKTERARRIFLHLNYRFLCQDGQQSAETALRQRQTD